MTCRLARDTLRAVPAPGRIGTLGGERVDDHGQRFQRGIRRFLEDLRKSERRSAKERREKERRVLDLPVDQDRRQGAERRAEVRRGQRDRRAPPAAQFSWTHTMQIQAMLARPSRGAACPRCGSALLLGPPEERAGVTTREVLCTGCRRSAAIVEDG